MSYQRQRAVDLGPDKAGLANVGYTLVGQARVGPIPEVKAGTGTYGGLITFPGGYSGPILWDSGETPTPLYVVGMINPGEDEHVQLDMTQAIPDVRTATVGGGLNGGWATAFGKMVRDLQTRLLSIWGSSSGTAPTATFLLDDATDPTVRTPQ